MDDLTVAWIVYGSLLVYCWFEAIWDYFKLRKRPYWRPMMLEGWEKIFQARITTQTWVKAQFVIAGLVTFGAIWMPGKIARWLETLSAPQPL
jgi:hypothetical protein